MRNADRAENHCMNYRAFSIASILSLLLSAGTAALWLRSYGVGTEVHFRSDGTRLELASRNGHIFIDNRPQIDEEGTQRHAKMVSHLDVLFSLIEADDTSGNVQAARERERAAIRHLIAEPRSAPWGISAAHWAIVLLMLLVPVFLYAIWTLRIQRLRRLPQRYLIGSL
jgi:hypothetical protein